jgi:L-histidine N-alpha-methyltransferase
MRASTIEMRCEYVAPTKRVPSLDEEVRHGLFGERKHLPPKYFYDDLGSALFDQICQEPEYYPTRTEDGLLSDIALQVIERSRPEAILELGSGMSRKTRRLFDACGQLEHYPIYTPFDVCGDVLIRSRNELTREYEWLDVRPLVGDYTAGLGNLPVSNESTLVLFLGGTIGNFTESQSLEFLRELRAVMNEGDHLLMGADRVKDPDVLHAAYNDEAGITAKFNLNLLTVLNRELDADFDPTKFEHYACYNPEANRIEMYLVCMQPQKVTFGGLGRAAEFKQGDAIMTEISRKFTRDAIDTLLRSAGFEICKHFEATTHAYSLVLAQAA